MRQRFVAGAAVLSLFALVTAAWQCARDHRRVERLSSRLAALQSNRATSAALLRATDPPEFIETLPSAPEVALAMQTLQNAADREGAQLMSLQAEDHAPTPAALGRLDLTLAIKAPYAATMAVIREVLDRYPGATLRQIQIAHAASSALAVPVTTPARPDGASAPSFASVSEAHMTLAFWRSPLNLKPAPLPQLVRPSEAAVKEWPAKPVAPSGVANLTGSTILPGAPEATPLPSIRRASSASK